MKPRILISRSPESSGFYETAVEKAGGEPMSFYCPDPDMDFDALILAGGGDVEPLLFREYNRGSRNIDLRRDEIEIYLVNRCVNENKPILGICRGHQVVNIALGGNIYQDMNDRMLEIHSQEEEATGKTHPVKLGVCTMLGDLYGEEMVVNTSHHQAVFKMGQGLYRTAWDENGVIEALQHASLPIWTVQFHPEQMTEENGTADGQKIFEFFLEKCRKNMGL